MTRVHIFLCVFSDFSDYSRPRSDDHHRCHGHHRHSHGGCPLGCGPLQGCTLRSTSTPCDPSRLRPSVVVTRRQQRCNRVLIPTGSFVVCCLLPTNLMVDAFLSFKAFRLAHKRNNNPLDERLVCSWCGLDGCKVSVIPLGDISDCPEGRPFTILSPL